MLLLCPVVTMNGQVQQPRPEKSANTKGSTSSGIKVWVTPLGNAPRPAEVTDENKGHLGWIVEEGNDEYQ